MDDSISRKQAIDVIRAMQTYKLFAGDDLILVDKAGVMTALMMLPSAQPERMKGRWTPHREKSCEYIGATLVYVTYDYWSCDTCCYRVEDGQPLYNFCPHCGADMIGVQE